MTTIDPIEAAALAFHNTLAPFLGNEPYKDMLEMHVDIRDHVPNVMQAMRAAIAAYEKAKSEASPDPESWILWHGGECPVAGNTTVAVKFRDGEVIEGSAELFDWSPHLPGSIEGHDAIIAYRVVKP